MQREYAATLSALAMARELIIIFIRVPNGKTPKRLRWNWTGSERGSRARTVVRTGKQTFYTTSTESSSC